MFGFEFQLGQSIFSLATRVNDQEKEISRLNKIIEALTHHLSLEIIPEHEKKLAPEIQFRKKQVKAKGKGNV